MENHPGCVSLGLAARNFLDDAATPPCGRARRGITLDSNLFTAPMTARISLNLGRTGGHRPPLQSEHFLPLGKAPLERQASNDLAGSRLCSGGLARDWAIPAVDPIDISETAHPPAPGVEDWRRSGIGAKIGRA